MSQTDQPATVAPPPSRKIRRKLLFVLGIVLVLLGAFFPVLNLFTPRPQNTTLTRSAPRDSEHLEVASMLEQNCLDCHAADTAMPPYASLPGARPLIEADRAVALRYMDMTRELASAEGLAGFEAPLAKLEYVLQHDTMPPTRYVAMHWNRRLSNEGKTKLLSWIRSVRRQSFATPGAPENVATDSLQPLPASVLTAAKKVALGERLYHDVRLSGDNTLSCASCHSLKEGGCDRVKSSTGIGRAVGPINSPTVYNAVFSVKQFWDGRADDLQAQAGGPVANPMEMGSNFKQVVEKLGTDSALVATFKEVYPEGLSQATITNAIAEFEKTLITPNSKFDRYLLGSAEGLTADEHEGLRLFRENACASCHVGKALGGQSFERMGRRADYFADRGNLTEADGGRFNVTKDERDRHFFKVPTLRNVALTWPYFHDGSQATLLAAVQTMARYQGYRPFSDGEANQVVAFLKTLTGEYKGTLLE